jgi:hypothetical protein
MVWDWGTKFTVSIPLESSQSDGCETRTLFAVTSSVSTTVYSLGDAYVVLCIDWLSLSNGSAGFLQMEDSAPRPDSDRE